MTDFRFSALCVALLSVSVMVESCGEKRKSVSPSPSQAEPVTPVPPSPVPPSPTPVPPSGGNVVEREQFMIFHNLKRCWHSADKIAWSDALATKAKMIAASCNKTYEAPDISSGHGAGLDVVKALDQWYLEGMVWYPYGRDEIPSDMRRFAAMVWKETREVGCAVAQCEGEPFFVCAYSQTMDETKASQNVTGLKPDFLGCSGL